MAAGGIVKDPNPEHPPFSVIVYVYEPGARFANTGEDCEGPLFNE
jgi:hypothetical protein